MNAWRPTILLALITLMGGISQAGVLEETFQADAHRVATTVGSAPLPAISVLVVRPDDGQRHPLALLLHGRGVDENENRRVGRADFPANARYLAGLGYAVLIPTRIGYGITGGPDIEVTGPCQHKSVDRALKTATLEVADVLDAARVYRWSDSGRVIAIGDSFGGLIALALATHPPRGLKAVINVSGGDGGDSLRHVDQPCDPAALAATLSTLGRTAQLPALFLYSRNDRFWGPDWPMRWFEAWQHGGGGGEFVWLPADKNNGHFIFNRNGPAWQAPAAAFLHAHGLPSISDGQSASIHGSPTSPSTVWRRAPDHPAGRSWPLPQPHPLHESSGEPSSAAE
jgi:dienelactone hydrolase